MELNAVKYDYERGPSLQEMHLFWLSGFRSVDCQIVFLLSQSAYNSQNLTKHKMPIQNL